MIKGKEYYIMIERMALTTSKFTISSMNIALRHCFCHNLEKKGVKKVEMEQINSHNSKIWNICCFILERKRKQWDYNYLKDSWFIHIIPYTINTVGNEIFNQICPPCTNFWLCIVREDTRSRPNVPWEWYMGLMLHKGERKNEKARSTEAWIYKDNLPTNGVPSAFCTQTSFLEPLSYTK